jgi:hypothetical protein
LNLKHLAFFTGHIEDSKILTMKATEGESTLNWLYDLEKKYFALIIALWDGKGIVMNLICSKTSKSLAKIEILDEDIAHILQTT